MRERQDALKGRGLPSMFVNVGKAEERPYTPRPVDPSPMRQAVFFLRFFAAVFFLAGATGVAFVGPVASAFLASSSAGAGASPLFFAQYAFIFSDWAFRAAADIIRPLLRLVFGAAGVDASLCSVGFFKPGNIFRSAAASCSMSRRRAMAPRRARSWSCWSESVVIGFTRKNEVPSIRASRWASRCRQVAGGPPLNFPYVLE